MYCNYKIVCGIFISGFCAMHVCSNFKSQCIHYILLRTVMTESNIYSLNVVPSCPKQWWPNIVSSQSFFVPNSIQNLRWADLR